MEKVKERICIGGTFWPLHRGHRTLLEEAFRIASTVYVGLTNDRMAGEMREREVAEYGVRYEMLGDYLDELSGRYGVTYEIQPLSDPYGPTLTGDYDGIVVSEETEKTAIKINEERLRGGLKPLRVHKVKMVLGAKGSPISSTRIMKGEMNEEGETPEGGK